MNAERRATRDRRLKLVATAAEIVDQILADLRTREGLVLLWDDLEPQVQQQIKDSWCGIATTVLAEAASPDA